MNILRSSENADYDWAIGLNRFCLKIVGLWPETDRNSGRTPRQSFRAPINTLLLVFGFTLPAFCALIKNRNDVMAIVDNLQFTLPLLITIAKFIVVSYKRKALLLVLNMIAKDWTKSMTTNERNVMIRRAQTARMITMCGYGMMAVSFVMLILLPGFGITFRYVANATDHGRLLPVQSYYFLYDVEKSPNFEMTFALQTVALAVAGIGYTGVDNFLGMLIFHICGQLENLEARLANTKGLEDFDRFLASNVKDHMRLIRSVDLVENAFTLLLLGLLLYFSTLFCVYGSLVIAISKQHGALSMLRTTYLSLVLLTVMGHTCLQFVVGEILASQSEGVYRAVCECQWNKLEPRKARNLIILLVRAKKPLCISAGKILPVTVPTFCSVRFLCDFQQFVLSSDTSFSFSSRLSRRPVSDIKGISELRIIVAHKIAIKLTG